MIPGMTTNHFTLAGAMLGSALAGALLTSWLGETTPQAAAQDAQKGGRLLGAVVPAAGTSLPVYRYQMVPLGERRFGIIDTRTGHCWTGDTEGNSLSDYGIPPRAEK